MITVPEYGVTIDKTASTQTTDDGRSRPITITVKNVGNQALPAVLVKDEALGFEQTIALAVGESKQFVLSPVTYTEAGHLCHTATAEDPGETSSL